MMVMTTMMGNQGLLVPCLLYGTSTSTSGNMLNGSIPGNSSMLKIELSANNITSTTGNISTGTSTITSDIVPHKLW
jgi:hypothetical protein